MGATDHEDGGPGRDLLVVAHPGHELCLHAWCGDVRPRLAILTLGARSGRARERIDHALGRAAARGLVASDLMGAFEDRLLYGDILAGDADPILRWTDRLRELILLTRPPRVVVDAWQGYSVAHDLTHLAAQVAAAEAETRTGAPIELLEFSPLPEAAWPRRVETALVLQRDLTAAEIAAKRADGWACEDLRGEMRDHGFLDDDALAGRERLWAVDRSWGDWRGVTPHYERFGRERVAAGVYRTVLTQAHFATIAGPMLERLAKAASQAPFPAPFPAPPAIPTPVPIATMA